MSWLGWFLRRRPVRRRRNHPNHYPSLIKAHISVMMRMAAQPVI